MVGDFDILDYLSGLTGFVFDKAVFKRIALERQANEVKSYDELTPEQKDLMLADLLYTIYISPNSSASSTMQHGAYSKTTGSQTINTKTGIYNLMVGIYKKYDDPKMDLINANLGGLSWME